jgi:hypothetical protein
VIYIREAHAADSPRARSTMSQDVFDPATFEEREDVARRAAKELEMGIPFAIDGMDDAVAKAYDAHPDRLYIVGADGNVAYQGGRGPKGFSVDAMEKRLTEILEASADE